MKKKRYYLTKKILTNADVAENGSIINGFLRKLCEQYPKHNDEKAIIAKIVIIGRTYAATLERKRKSKKNGDDFYHKLVAPKVRASNIDKWLRELSGVHGINNKNFNKIVEVHHRVMKLFGGINGSVQKRSLASKYLHFHFPNLYYIYDARSTGAMSKVVHERCGIRNFPKCCDKKYASFVCKCILLRKIIHGKINKQFNPRKIDNVLLKIYSRHSD